MNTFAVKRKGILLGLLFSFLSIIGSAQPEQNITGNWRIDNDKKPRQMEIYRAGDGNYYGKIINDNSQDSKNGKVILKALKYNEKSDSYIGKLESPDNGTEIDVAVSFAGNKRLKVVGKKFLMTRTFYFSRIK